MTPNDGKAEKTNARKVRLQYLKVELVCNSENWALYKKDTSPACSFDTW